MDFMLRKKTLPRNVMTIFLTYLYKCCVVFLAPEYIYVYMYIEILLYTDQEDVCVHERK